MTFGHGAVTQMHQVGHIRAPPGIPRVSCSGEGAAARAARGVTKPVSYQQPPDERTDTRAGAPPGWYLDPEGRQELRWWDGTRWGPHTQPLPGVMQESQHPYPGVVGSASSGYGSFQQDRVGRHRLQSGQRDGTTFLSSLAADPHAVSFPAAELEQPDIYKPQEPQDSSHLQGWLEQSAFEPGPQPQAQHVPRRSWSPKARHVLIGLGVLVVAIVATSVAIERGAFSSGHAAATSVAASAASSNAAPSATAQPLTCESIASWMQPVVSDQASQDASEEQNWVELVPSAGGGSNLTNQGQDLQNAASMAQNAPSGSTLGADLQAFANGASAFLANEDQGLYPGWNSFYQPLRTDIYAISHLCGWPSSS